MGYECQISNEMIDGNPLAPADCRGGRHLSAGQDARVVAGEPGKPVTVVLIARGPHFAAWVNGVQVSDAVDQRNANETRGAVYGWQRAR